MNRKLRYINEHQKCVLVGREAELEAARQELLEARVCVADRLTERGERERLGVRNSTAHELKMVSENETVCMDCHTKKKIHMLGYALHSDTHGHTHTHTHTRTHARMCTLAQTRELNKQLQSQLSGVREEHQAVLAQLKQAHTLLDKHIETCNKAQESEVCIYNLQWDDIPINLYVYYTVEDAERGGRKISK